MAAEHDRTRRRVLQLSGAASGGSFLAGCTGNPNLVVAQRLARHLDGVEWTLFDRDRVADVVTTAL